MKDSGKGIMRIGQMPLNCYSNHGYGGNFLIIYIFCPNKKTVFKQCKSCGNTVSTQKAVCFFSWHFLLMNFYIHYYQNFIKLYQIYTKCIKVFLNERKIQYTMYLGLQKCQFYFCWFGFCFCLLVSYNKKNLKNKSIIPVY